MTKLSDFKNIHTKLTQIDNASEYIRKNIDRLRKDIEDDGYFSACFSYNTNTNPTPPKQKSKARIHVCSFNNPDDAFSKFLIESWRNFLHT